MTQKPLHVNVNHLRGLTYLFMRQACHLRITGRVSHAPPGQWLLSMFALASWYVVDFWS